MNQKINEDLDNFLPPLILHRQINSIREFNFCKTPGCDGKSPPNRECGKCDKCEKTLNDTNVCFWCVSNRVINM